MKIGNNVFKKSFAVVLLACAGLGGAHAADPQSYTIDLTAVIPSDSFHVIPVESGWINQTQAMSYDLATSKLKPFEKEFQYKNTSGAIQATLTNTNADGAPVLSNGSGDTIPLTVKFNNKTLSDTAATVVESAAAAAGGRTTLSIAQANTSALDVMGSFSGSVSMIFEPVVES
ncbi:CS1 type fimbrial major subunit [Erwinia billingiae]|uniref:CS1 type fimbrial major subunit n=1 Tax=Erwinia billingiae TaxID=182337 RepID=UPI00320B711F